MKKTRRTFIKHTSLAAGAGMLWWYGCGQPNASSEGKTTGTEDSTMSTPAELFFQISLAEWSLHRSIRDRKEISNLDFPVVARTKFGIGAVEYVSQLFPEKGHKEKYLAELNKRAADHGVKNVLIMVDNEGHLAETNAKERNTAIENHHKWVHAAAVLGCHSIRVNAYSSNPDRAEAAKAAVAGLGTLAEYAKNNGGINVIVENHGGYSSDGKWLSGVMAQINMPNCGTLPDFGNFCVKKVDGKCVEEYDRYLGVKEMLPYAKGVSAKTHEFDAAGNETQTDYRKMLQLVKDAGYRGHIGVEYEGNEKSEEEGIRLTKALLEKIGAAIS